MSAGGAKRPGRRAMSVTGEGILMSAGGAKRPGRRAMSVTGKGIR